MPIPNSRAHSRKKPVEYTPIERKEYRKWVKRRVRAHNAERRRTIRQNRSAVRNKWPGMARPVPERQSTRPIRTVIASTRETIQRAVQKITTDKRRKRIRKTPSTTPSFEATGSPKLISAIQDALFARQTSRFNRRIRVQATMSRLAVVLRETCQRDKSLQRFLNNPEFRYAGLDNNGNITLTNKKTRIRIEDVLQN
jgi:hypothetical protein